jgi:lipopolysaccharide/colanic/teichoic acid biosynthesis glycosyltransferase
VVIGDRVEAERFVADLNAENGGPCRRLAAAVPLTDVSDLERAVSDAQPHGVVLLDPCCPGRQLTAVADVCRRRRVPLQVYAAGLEDDDVAVLHGDDHAFFAVPPASARPRPYRVKRLLDVTVAGGLLVLFSPFFAVVAALTKLGSPGPAFYVSWRMGAGEVAFPCYKFRTMVVDADVQQEELESRNEADGCLFKIKDDPRITPTGRFLRRTSLDELPQLINVLRGEMSLVGPRPLPLRDVARMEPEARRRHSVLPGITGLWQTGGRSGLTAADMMRLDLEYIRTWSLGLDLRILWRTAGVVIRGKGAY